MFLWELVRGFIYQKVALLFFCMLLPLLGLTKYLHHTIGERDTSISQLTERLADCRGELNSVLVTLRLDDEQARELQRHIRETAKAHQDDLGREFGPGDIDDFVHRLRREQTAETGVNPAGR